MKLGSDSHELAMLEHLANLPRFRHAKIRTADLCLSLCDIASQRSRREALKKLHEKGSIRIEKACVGLTEQGENTLAESDPWYSLHPLAPATVPNALVSRDLFRAGVMSLCAGAGIICLRRDKPDLVQLCAAMTHRPFQIPLYETDYRRCSESECLARLDCGIWYGAAEVRQFLRETSGSEPVYSSRFCGIALTGHDLYVFYHTGSRLGHWCEQAEQTLHDALSSAFLAYAPYGRPLQGYNRHAGAIGVVIGNSVCMIPALVMGFVHGRVVNRRSLDDTRRQAMFKVLCARSGVYQYLFYCPMSEYGAWELAKILHNTPEQLQKASHCALEKIPGVHPYGEPPCCPGSIPALDLEIVDLRLLAAGRKSHSPLVVLTRGHLARWISHALGDRFLRAIDRLSLQEIPCPFFDRYGYERGTNPATNVKRVERQERLTMRMDHADRLLLERQCAREGKTISDLMTLLARQYLIGKKTDSKLQEGTHDGTHRI